LDEIPLAHEAIILDACCVINLYASGRMQEILESMEKAMVIADYVCENEALTIRSFDSDAEEPIDLQPFIEAGLLIIASLNSGAEEITFVNFAAEVDDGEAITGALAFHRDWAVGSDDGAAIDTFRRLAPRQQIVTTPELIKHWVDSASPPRKAIADTLRAVRHRGKYGPGRDHFLHDWWQSFLEDE
jgi:hypothetical protein